MIRNCEAVDLAAVVAIEIASYPHPWSELQFLQELQAPYSQLKLLQVGQEIAGYICYWLAAGELHILNVATAPNFRRCGTARKLLEHALAQARATGAERAFLEVRTGNRGAIALYREFGFTDDGLRRGYYSNGEDALLMSCPLLNSACE